MIEGTLTFCQINKSIFFELKIHWKDSSSQAKKVNIQFLPSATFYHIY